MLIPRFIAGIFSVALMIVGTGAVSAQDYPNKTIRIIASTPGGGSDFQARQIGQGISGTLGQPVVIDNRPSILVAEVGVKGAPDGYTLTIQGASLWIGPLLRKAPYDPVSDFAPITMISREVFILAVHPSLPVKSIKDLIALAKSRPGELIYSVSTPGGPSFLGMELFKSMTGVRMLNVPYKGTSQVVTAVLSGETQLTVGDVALVAPHAKSGRLKALAVTSLDTSALAPGLPSIAESGLPGFEVVGATGMWAPAKTPSAIVTRLNQEIVRFLVRAEVKERFLGNQVEVVANTPEQFAAIIKADIAKWGKVFKDAGIKLE